MRILMPVDGSPHSNAALAFIASRRSLLESQPEVELLNVQHPVSARVARGAGRGLVRQHHALESDKILKPAMALLERAGVEPSARAWVGLPGAEVAHIALQDAADLIVMGSHGRSGLRGLLFGSVTQAVLACCDKPLLVLRGGTAPRRESLRVGIALDGSRGGLASVRFVTRHRTLFGATPGITLLHVVPDPLDPGWPKFFGVQQVPGCTPAQAAEMQRAAFERVMAPARRLLRAGGLLAAEALLVSNYTADAIAAQARRSRLDLLVLGTHRAGRLRAALLGSVATRVAARCRTALLLIRQN